MAEPAVVGRTRVSLIPDTTQFAPRLLQDLPKAVRPAGKRAGDVLGKEIVSGARKELLKYKPVIKVGIDLDTGTAKADLDRLTARRTVKVVAELDDAKARTDLDRLTADRKVKVTVDIDETSAKAKLGQLLGQRTVDILPKIQQAAYNTAVRQLDRLTADRTVIIRASADTRVAADELRNLARRQRVRIGVDVDTRVAADDIANLTRRRQVRVEARADTAAAATALRFLTRDRDINVRVRAGGLSALTSSLGSLGSGGGSGGLSLGLLTNKIFLLTTAAISALPTLASFTQALIQMGPAAAIAAPALALLITSFTAVKLGLTGLSDAFKAAFADPAAEMKAAATAARQVESAQRSLANAQRGVTDAERALTQAQRAARQVQQELSAARREATRDLQDMNARLRQGRLDQEQAVLDLKQAEADLVAIRTNPKATQLQKDQAELAVRRARESVDEQARQQKRLEADTKAANKAGVEGSSQVLQAKERIRSANEQVAQQERGLADAHRAVAEASKALAAAQENAASQTSKLDQAMAKLSPNARGFVTAIQSLAPAWTALRLDVQDRLFAGIGTRLTGVAQQVLPTLRTGLGGTATELNHIGRNALTAVANLEKSKTLGKIFDGVRSSLRNLTRLPGQLVTGFAQLSVAAQPAFDRVTSGAASVMDRVMAKLDTAFKNGKLTDAINDALDVAIQFGHVLGDAFGIVRNIMGAAGDAGGDFFGTIGAALKEIRRVTEMPEVQAALTSIFKALNAVAKLIAGALGQAIQAVLPVLATLSPVIVQIASLLAPVVADLLKTLGEALMPIAQALGPVLVVAARAVIALVQALSPLLPVIGNLIASLLPPLTPILETLVTSFTVLAPVVAIVANVLGRALAPIIAGLGEVIGELVTQYQAQFLEIFQQLLPVIPQLIPVVLQLADSIGQILVALAPLLPQIMLLAVQLISQLLPAILPLIEPLVLLETTFLRFATWAIVKVVIPAIGLIVGALAKLREGMQPAVDAVKWVTETIAKGFEWLYDFLLGHSVIPDIVNGAIGWFTSLWTRGKKIFNDLRSGAAEIWNALWNRVRTIASDAWGAVRRGFDSFGERLTESFRTVRDGLGKVWKGLQELVKAPIRFWIETVYNKGIVSVWNKTAGKIPGVPDMSTMNLPKGFARGGILPGYSTYRQGDDQLVPMRRGEGVYVSEAMRDPYERARLHAINAAAMSGRNLSTVRLQYGFAEGGIIGSIKSAGSSIASSVGDVLGKGADIARGGLADLAEKAFSPVKSGIKKALGTNTSTWPGAVAGGPLNLIDKAIDFIRGADTADGSWIKPVNVPYGTKFGVRGSMWASGRHTGLDFPAATGTRIKAVASGTVSSIATGGPYGRHATISHGGGLSSLYAHMSSIVAKAGQAIGQGSIVGRVGATGNVTGPHLHLEARINGRAVDPLQFLEGGAGGAAGGAIGGSGVNRWRGTVTQALREVGASVSNVNLTLRRMNQESGGNPLAVNRWDSNWHAGHPSVGLMQVIRGTYRAHAGRYRNKGPFLYGVSTDPLANIYASMRYALAQYGSLSRAYNRPGGYAMGGVVGSPVRSTGGYTAAADASRMARLVRSTVTAGASRMEPSSAATTYGDRHLHYNATTREVASRQSVLAALELEDQLHRPIVSGG